MDKNIFYFINKSKNNEFIKYAISEFRFMNWLNDNNDFVDNDIKERALFILGRLNDVTDDTYEKIYNDELDNSLIKRLLTFKPLSMYIFDNDDEWEEIENNKFQNKRYFSIFKEVDNNGNVVSIYDIDGNAIYDENGEEIYLDYEDKKKDINFPYFIA